MDKFKAAVVQMNLREKDVNTNLKRATEIVGKIAKEDVDIVCLPEYLTTGQLSDSISGSAESIPGSSTETMGDVAEEHGVYIVFSMAEKVDQKRYNTAVLIGPEGDVLGKHRKMHRFLDERAVVTPGDSYTVVSTDLGKLGLMVCYDAVFPELSRNLALMDADVLLMPSNWPDPFKPQWEIATSARALDNQLWVIAANRIGGSDNYTYFGGSRIVDPTGCPVVECGGGEEVAVGTIDPAVTKSFKDVINFLEDRRDDYTL